MSGMAVAFLRSEAAQPLGRGIASASVHDVLVAVVKPPWVSDPITRSGDLEAIGFRWTAPGKFLCGASGAGASPGDGVFGPVSPVYLLTRPNRMTVSLGTRAGVPPLTENYCPFCF